MTRAEYHAALDELGLSPAAKATARALGVTVRQAQRYAAGEPIPDTIALLLNCYVAARKRLLPEVIRSYARGRAWPATSSATIAYRLPGHKK